MFLQCSITTGYEPVVALSKILTAPPTSLVLGTPRSLVSAAYQNTRVTRYPQGTSKIPVS